MSLVFSLFCFEIITRCSDRTFNPFYTNSFYIMLEQFASFGNKILTVISTIYSGGRE